MRELFEAWHQERFGWCPNRRKSKSGAYHNGNAQSRWIVWQAAMVVVFAAEAELISKIRNDCKKENSNG